jgi:hypothetical protein
MLNALIFNKFCSKIAVRFEDGKKRCKNNRIGGAYQPKRMKVNLYPQFIYAEAADF